jgi:hypothetical protein
MVRPRANARLITLLPAVILMGCSNLSLPTDAPPRMSASTSALAAKGSDHAGAIIGHDSCDPASFDAVLGEGACAKPGGLTFQALIAELSATQTVRSWRFNPLQVTTHAGEALLVQNVGGVEHTFTPVRQFGGGFIPDLNALSGNPVPAPECLNVPALDFVLSGEKSLISGAALASVADASGIAKVECCLHPWMRTEVRIK